MVPSMSSSAADSLFPALAPCAAPQPDVESRSQSGREDDDLMARVQAGDEAALGILLDRHARLVLGIGRRILRDPGEAQELVQDVFLHVYRKSHLFSPRKGTFRAWLTTISCHRALDRREYLNLHRFYDGRNLDDFTDVFKKTANLQHEVEFDQCDRILRKAFEELPNKQRLTLRLYFCDGYTLREISDRLNETLPNIRHYYYRALEHLRSNTDLSSLKEKAI